MIMLNPTKNSDNRPGVLFIGLQIGTLIILTSLNVLWVYVIRSSQVFKYIIAFITQLTCIFAFMNTLDLFDEIEIK